MDLTVKPTYLLLGSNIGDRYKYMETALQLLEAMAGKIVTRSALYETDAWGNEDQDAFLNLAARIDTHLSPVDLMDTILEIEKKMGRIRDQRWGPRPIDIDIIFYGSEIISIPDKLIVPHPEMHKRKFVLVPLAEIAGQFIHPVAKRSVEDILLELNDPLEVRRV